MMTTRHRGWLGVLLLAPLLIGQGCPAPGPAPDPGGDPSNGGTNGGGSNNGGSNNGGSGGSGQNGLTVLVQGQGSVEPAGGSYATGSIVTLTAQASPGWRFVRWEGDLTGEMFANWRDARANPANPARLTMSSSKTVTAVFVEQNTETTTFNLPGGVPLTVIHIPGGSIMMGSTASEQATFGALGVDLADESPRFSATVSPFAIGETEVTQGQFRAVMGFVPTIPQGCTVDCANGALSDELPVAWTSWTQAVAFCDALSGLTGRFCRLPTEAEWEYACRAGTETAFSFGEPISQLGDYAWHVGNSGWPGNNNARAVASKLPNQLGLYDMHGNVWEWVGDWFGEYPAEPQVNPTGPTADKVRGPRKILRGGAYSRHERYLRSAYRYDPGGPDGAQFNFGFRVVCE